jgi:hypothetical protein
MNFEDILTGDLAGAAVVLGLVVICALLGVAPRGWQWQLADRTPPTPPPPIPTPPAPAMVAPLPRPPVRAADARRAVELCRERDELLAFDASELTQAAEDWLNFVFLRAELCDLVEREIKAQLAAIEAELTEIGITPD